LPQIVLLQFCCRFSTLTKDSARQDRTPRFCETARGWGVHGGPQFGETPHPGIPSYPFCEFQAMPIISVNPCFRPDHLYENDVILCNLYFGWMLLRYIIISNSRRKSTSESVFFAPEDAKELRVWRGPRNLQQGTIQTTALLFWRLRTVLTVLQGLQ
jgi:hypothetical protein